MSASGVLYVHSALPALCPHVEWAIAGVIGRSVTLSWTQQPAAPGTLRAELSWKGRAGTAAAIASALRGWQRLRFEVTEDPLPGTDGLRYSATPSLGMFCAVIGASGDIQVPENRLRVAMQQSTAGDANLTEQLETLLGGPWDDELEPFRQAGDGAPVRWLHAAV